MTTALIYVRQSRHKEGDRTVSPETQEASCRALPAVARCETIEVFRDLDLSGGKMAGRRGLASLLERLAAGGVSVIAAFDQSRAFRNTTDALAFFALMEKHPAVDVVFVHGRFDRSPVGGFTYTTLAAAHEMERRLTGEKISAAYRFAAARGEMVGQVPGGYLRMPDGSVAIDEAAAATVRRIFTEYASGLYSARKIAMRLNAQAIPPLPRSRGAGWRFYSVVELLRNIAYTGHTRTGSRRRKGTGDLMAAQWPPIIELELWESAQRLLSRRNGRGGRRPAGQERPYAFRGLLRCSCGARMSAACRDGRLVYQCPRGADAKPCTEHRVHEEALLPWARALFEQLEALTPADFDAAVEELASQGRRHTSPDALQSIDRSLERAEQLFMWGHWPAERYQTERERLTGLRAELLGATAPAPVIQLRGVLDAWDLGDGVTRRELLAALFDHLHVSDGKIIGYTARHDREGEILKLMEAMRRRVMKVGGDGLSPAMVTLGAARAVVG
jgi:DNA invertase Pin-like site-specific DNA recombinase